jgi:hypothetical protein
MNYTVRVIKDDEVIASKQFDEHPAEAVLDQLVADTDGDYADVSRN